MTAVPCTRVWQRTGCGSCGNGAKYNIKDTLNIKNKPHAAVRSSICEDSGRNTRENWEILACPIHLHSATIAGRHLVRCYTEFCMRADNCVSLAEATYGKRLGAKYVVVFAPGSGSFSLKILKRKSKFWHLNKPHPLRETHYVRWSRGNAGLKQQQQQQRHISQSPCRSPFLLLSLFLTY